MRSLHPSTTHYCIDSLILRLYSHTNQTWGGGGGGGKEASVDVYTSSESPPNTMLMFSKSTGCPFTAEMMSPAHLGRTRNHNVMSKFLIGDFSKVPAGNHYITYWAKKKVQLLDSRGHTPCESTQNIALMFSERRLLLAGL